MSVRWAGQGQRASGGHGQAGQQGAAGWIYALHRAMRYQADALLLDREPA